MMKTRAGREWNADKVLELARSYQAPAVLAAAADLDLFNVLGAARSTAKAVAQRLRCDRRGLTILLDALAALRLLRKRGDRYALAPGVERCLTAGGAGSVLAMTQHQANCLRRWTQLAQVIKTTHPAELRPSVRGEQGDQEAFIGAMHDVSAPAAAQVIRGIRPRPFEHLLDVGGASGTWTIAILRAHPSARATLFDLPSVIGLARRRLAAAGLLERVQLVGGDFSKDALPRGADLAWVSAIVHQHSRAQNRQLFKNVRRALRPGGRIAIRDILMDATRTRPVAGALFAVNMLVATAGGGTFTFEELREDLAAAGFTQATVARRDAGMNSVVVARKNET
jgi:precorrin-6B methylase 2